MEKVKTTNDIDDALESAGASILDIDTVAVWSEEEGMYGVYVKHPANPVWELQMTTIRLESIMQ